MMFIGKPKMGKQVKQHDIIVEFGDNIGRELPHVPKVKQSIICILHKSMSFPKWWQIYFKHVLKGINR